MQPDSSVPPQSQDQRVAKMLLRRDKISEVTAESLTTFYSMLRLINSLRSIHKLQVKLASTADKLEAFKDRIDLHFYAIG